MTSVFHSVLVLAPHTDDGEFGCGGFLAKLIEEGANIHYVAFSAAEKSVPAEFESGVLRREVKEATGVLGLPEDNLMVLNYEVRQFPAHRQEILEDMIRIKKDWNPDLVLLPSLNDIHQDHKTIAEEGVRAFKDTTILGYELPWNNLSINTTSFVYLQERHIQKKIAALHCYESQRFRPYASETFIRSLAITRGTQIGAQYAEVFEVIRWVMP